MKPQNDVDQPLKKQGIGAKRRAKTGCRTCRVRHVKCDEERPACRRCVLARIVCDGYGIWGGGGNPYARSQSHSQSTSQALLVYQPPSLIGSLSREEHVAFDWFMQKNTTQLSGLFSSAFWDTLVFQASAQEPAVRHAVIALSSAQKAELLHRDLSSRCETDEEKFTLVQYNKAIGYLRTQKNQHQDTNSTRIVLITCMIFIALEYLRGRYKMGFTHLQYGFSLLSENERRHHHHQQQHPSSSSTLPILIEPKGEFAQTALVDAFTRLSVQSTLYGQSMQKVYVSARQNTIPHVFCSVAEARRILDQINAHIYCLERYFQNPHLDSAVPILHHEHKELYETRQKILIDLSLWKTAYDASILQLDSSYRSRQNKLSFLLMNMYHAMATIKASVCLEPGDEMGFDRHTAEFTTIITGCHQLWYHLQLLNGISNPDPQRAECGGTGFTLEMGFIPPVYFTAIKCRVPRIRRQAKNILCSGLHREAGWDRQLISELVLKVIQMEEGDFYCADGRRQIPDEPSERDFDPPSQYDLAIQRIDEWQRISDVRIVLPDDPSGSNTLSFRKRSDDGSWTRSHRKF